jgi:beta-lactamase regulating signal transducer with metallopeptidase domain
MMPGLLARASLEGSLAAVLVWIAIRCLPRLSAATRTALWWCVAARFLLALVWITPVELRVLPSRSAVANAVCRLPARAGQFIGPAARLAATSPRRTAPVETSTVDWAAVLLVLWSAGLAAVAAVDVRRLKQTRAAVRRSQPAGDETAGMAETLAAAMGMRRVPAVLISADIATPLVTGLWRPRILLPWNGATALSAAEQRMALCHELSHVRRADLWLGLVPAAAERLFFFHPLVRLAAREYSLCREAACDAAVIETVAASARDYGRLLLALGVSRHRGGLAVAGASSSSSMLKRRIAMLRDSSPSTTGQRAVSVLAIAAMAAAVLPLRLAARPQSPAAAGTPETSAAEAAAARPARAGDLRGIWFGPGRAWIGGGDAREALVPPDDERQDARGNLYLGTGKKDLNYVLLLDDHNANMSGSVADVDRARRFRRGAEPLLWIQRNGAEHVVRDSKLIQQALAIWVPVNELGTAQGVLGGKQGALGTQQGVIGAQQGAFGMQQGLLGTRQGEIAGRQTVLSGREQAAMSAAERRAVDDARRQLDAEAGALEAQMRALDVKMRELDQPMRDLDREISALSAQMETLGRQMEEASRRAEQQMLELIDEAIATGAAERVR